MVLMRSVRPAHDPQGRRPLQGDKRRLRVSAGFEPGGGYSGRSSERPLLCTEGRVEYTLSGDPSADPGLFAGFPTPWWSAQNRHGVPPSTELAKSNEVVNALQQTPPLLATPSVIGRSHAPNVTAAYGSRYCVSDSGHSSWISIQQRMGGSRGERQESSMPLLMPLLATLPAASFSHACRCDPRERLGRP